MDNKGIPHELTEAADRSVFVFRIPANRDPGGEESIVEVEIPFKKQGSSFIVKQLDILDDDQWNALDGDQQKEKLFKGSISTLQRKPVSNNKGPVRPVINLIIYEVDSTGKVKEIGDLDGKDFSPPIIIKSSITRSDRNAGKINPYIFADNLWLPLNDPELLQSKSIKILTSSKSNPQQIIMELHHWPVGDRVFGHDG